MEEHSMDGSQLIRHGGARWAALPVAATLLLAVGGATMAQSPAAGASAAAGEPLEIAYLSFAVANSYDAPMLAAAEEAAAALGANITVFDANNDFAAQTKQLQDAVTAGTYDGIITQPIYGGGLLTDVQNAIAQGIKVVNIDQVLGNDFTTAASQIDGLSGNVVFVPSEMGRKIGELAVQACADADPCNVGYVYSVKISGLDAALRAAFDAAIAVNPAIKVVADTAESYYTAAGGLKAAQDYLVANPDINVIVGADQAIQGALGAVDPAVVGLVGYGGSAKAIQDIVDGKQFGTVVQLPATEGRLGVEQLVDAIRNGTVSEGIDTLATLPDGGVVTKANAEQFLTLAEWPG
jgi:ribose transport system substrate-binding protein